jgi:PPOX class probable F420-dependent enzyme
MQFADLEALVQQQRTVVLTTYRRDGRPQMSLVGVGSYEGGLALTTPRGSAKGANLRRDLRCAILVPQPNWRGYAVLDGDAEVRDRENMNAEKLRLDLQQVYRAVAGQDHPDWPEYDRAMVEQKRLVVILRPGRMVGVGVP